MAVKQTTVSPFIWPIHAPCNRAPSAQFERLFPRTTPKPSVLLDNIVCVSIHAALLPAGEQTRVIWADAEGRAWDAAVTRDLKDEQRDVVTVARSALDASGAYPLGTAEHPAVLVTLRTVDHPAVIGVDPYALRLPIMLSMMAVTEQIIVSAEALENMQSLGCVGLDGRINHQRGAVAAALHLPDDLRDAAEAAIDAGEPFFGTDPRRWILAPSSAAQVNAAETARTAQESVYRAMGAEGLRDAAGDLAGYWTRDDARRAGGDQEVNELIRARRIKRRFTPHIPVETLFNEREAFTWANGAQAPSAPGRLAAAVREASPAALNSAARGMVIEDAKRGGAVMAAARIWAEFPTVPEAHPKGWACVDGWAQEHVAQVIATQGWAGIYDNDHPFRNLKRRAWRTFRAPHHTVSEMALVGHARQAGEIDLSESGVLLLDDAAEFTRAALEVLVGELRDRRDAGHPRPFVICVLDSRGDMSGFETAADRFWKGPLGRYMSEGAAPVVTIT